LKKLNTEKELIYFDKFQIYRLAKLASRDMEMLEAISLHMPFYITLNNRITLDTSFASQVLEDMMELDLSEISQLGFEKIKEISDPHVLEYALGIVKNYQNTGCQESMCSYLQRLYMHNDFKWITTYKTVFDETQYFNVGYPIERLGKPGEVLMDVLDDVLVKKHGWERFEMLTAREIEVLGFVAKGYTSTEISEKLFLSDHTIKTHRKNIGYKLGIKNNSEWVRFAMAFEMI
jgi:DNA-binding CsgD family transcriptional regulator